LYFYTHYVTGSGYFVVENKTCVFFRVSMEPFYNLFIGCETGILKGIKANNILWSLSQPSFSYNRNLRLTFCRPFPSVHGNSVWFCGKLAVRCLWQRQVVAPIDYNQKYCCKLPCY